MKFSATVWPLTVTYEITDAFLASLPQNGIDLTQTEIEKGLKEGLRDQAYELIVARAIMIAKAETDNK